jgi:hypothetical protein
MTSLFDCRSRPMYRASVAAGGGVRPPNTRPPHMRGLPRGAPSLGPRPAPGPGPRPGPVRGQFPVRGRFMPPGPAGRPLRPRGGVVAAPAARGFPPPQPPVRYSARPPRAMMRGAHSVPRAPAGMMRPAPVAPPQPQPVEDPEPQPWEHYYQLD